MSIEIITKEDLENFRVKLLGEIKDLLIKEKSQKEKKWLRSSEVMELLGISMSTLQNLSINGSLHPSKIGGLNYYKYDEIEDALNKGIEKAKLR